MKIETILDHQTIFENRRPQIFFAVRFLAPELAAPTTPAVAYCVVVDLSASMDERASSFGRRFAAELIRHLPPNALLSIVTFHETAESIFDLGPVADKPALQAFMNDLAPADFGTNLSAALLLAREQFSHAPASTTSKKILLLTDGEHTAGIRDESLLAKISADCRVQGIQITSLHLGETNRALLEQISSTCYPQPRGEDLMAILSRELGALQPLAVQNLRLRLKPLDFCERIEPLGFEFDERSDGWLTHNLGDMLSNEERTVCFNLTIPLLPCIDDQPFASLANESLLELEAGYELVTPAAVLPKTFATTIRIPPFSTSYPSSEDGSLTLREEA
jgi:hypothetical protein